MTAQYVTDALITPTEAVDAARAHVTATALVPSAGGRVGLELEFHLVDRNDPGRRPDWPTVQGLVAGLPPMPSGSAVSVEPGGQLELSTPPAQGVAAAVAALRDDRAALRTALAGRGYGTAPLGADPARPLQRINPAARYVAMEQHFAALDCAGPGRAMMTGTAALQVNLDAGPGGSGLERLARADRLGPVLVAVSATSPALAGRRSGWASMRQQAWHGIGGRSAPLPPGDPAAAWAEYALAAPVMLVRDGGGVAPVTARVPFAAWLRGDAPIARRPTVDDLDYHLTTLFPPVRPRGYLELRCLDAAPDRWWPALAAVATTLLDDPVASDAAEEACAPVADRWARAARDGLADAALLTAAGRCVAVAAERCPPELAADVAALADLVSAGRSPGDELRERMDDVGPLAVLEEESRA